MTYAAYPKVYKCSFKEMHKSEKNFKIVISAPFVEDIDGRNLNNNNTCFYPSLYFSMSVRNQGYDDFL